ncbi:MAG: NAD(P)H-dependent oxidoreductase subunit E [Spirochaetales bacterium]|nr:NAD(P)H-dependent oxidoreductase subunit E [Spirochaetales bacterium]
MENNNLMTLLEKTDMAKGRLISVLEKIQTMYGYLPEDVLRTLSDKTGHSLVDIYGVATFYRAFSLKPRGKHLVLVCLGTACHVRGARKIAEEFQQLLGINAGETTPDKEFTIETVNCLGACALGPTVVVDGHYFSHVTVKKVRGIINKTLEGLDTIDIKTDKRIFPVKVCCSVCRQSLLDSSYLIDGYPSIHLNRAYNGKRGWFRLSSLYGSFNSASEFEISPDSLYSLYCPHCKKELLEVSQCPECNAPMASMLIKNECTIEVCTRSGCRGHMMNLNQINITE